MASRGRWPAKTEADISEIVVSATRFEEERWKSGSSITVVPEGNTRLKRPFQITDAIRGEAGVEPGLTANNNSGAAGGLSQISIRGVGFSRTLIQVDGLRFNRPIDGIANLSDLAPLLTGNIEILRGPQSSLYGSEAEGGVVSLNAPAGKGKPTWGASFEAGTFNTRRERIFSQGKEEKFDWNFESSRLDTDQERPNNNLRQDAAAMRLGYDLSEIARVDLVSRYTDFTVGAPSGLTGFGANDPDDRLIRRMMLISPSFLVVPVEKWESKLVLGYIGVGQRFDTPPSQFVNHSESLQLNWQNTIEVAEWNTVIVGGEARNEHTTTEASSGDNVFNRAAESAYFSDSIRWEDGWGLTMSARYDDNEGFRDVWTYRASQFVKMPVTDTRLHMSFGTGFRAPTISELQPLFGAFSGANASLVPETTEGYDIGVTQPLLDGKLEGDCTYFYNNIVNFIGADAAFTFQNISEVRSEGIETSMKWQATDELSVRGMFTLMSTTSKDIRFSGNDLPRMPRESASFTIRWQPLKELETALLWTYNGTTFDNATNTRELRDFSRVDLFLSYQVTPWMKLFGRGENLLGYRYQQAASFPALGRTFYAGVEVQF